MSTIKNKLRKASNGTRAVPTSLSAAKAAGAATASINVNTGWPSDTDVDVVMYLVDTSGNKVAGSQTDWVANISGTTLSNMDLRAGTEPATGYPGTTSTVVTVRPTAAWNDDLIDALLGVLNQDGSFKTAPIQTALGLGAGSLNGWNALGYAPNTVVANGNRSYTLTFNGVDLTATLSAGMRLRTTRTVAAPTQSTSLNGTSQYYTKTAPAGMSQADNITVMAWIKPTAYQTGFIASRMNGSTDGWYCQLNSSGQVVIAGARAADDVATSYQSVPLNKWVHVAATISSTGAVSTMYIDGVSVPVNYTNNANTSFLTPTGTFAIGATSTGTSPFAGKLAQVAVFSAVLSAATIQSYYCQSLLGTETNLISAYSFNGVITDLNTTNANNLTANGSAVATNADSPYGGQASGTISSTLDYCIIQKASFSTNTTLVVQVPEGCTIPTSGGVASVVYSSAGKPYGMPIQKNKYTVELISRAGVSIATASNTSWYNIGGYNIALPAGEWSIGGAIRSLNTVSVSSGFVGSNWTLSTANNSASNPLLTKSSTTTSAGSTETDSPVPLAGDISNSALTTWYLNVQPVTVSGTTMVYLDSSSNLVFYNNYV